MKILKAEIHNFKGIDSLSIDTQGKHVYLIGPNASCKTSVIDALVGNIPEQPVKQGERKGDIEITLDNGVVIERKFNAKNNKKELKIYDPQGAEISSPATVFKQLFGVAEYNIEKFLSLSDKEQLEKVKQIIGVDFKEMDLKYNELYQDRRDIGKLLKEKEAEEKANFYNSAMKPKIDTTALKKDISDVSSFNATIETIENRMAERCLEIKALEETLKAKKEAFFNDEEFLKKHGEKKNIRELQDALDKAEEHNKAVERNDMAKVIHDKVKEHAALLEKIQEEMDAINAEKANIIAAADMPVKGMTFDSEQLLLDGLPFRSNQINTARRIIAGLELAIFAMGECRVAYFDGSLLDNKSLDQVKEWAATYDIQMFVEFVQRDGEGLTIEIVE